MQSPPTATRPQAPVPLFLCSVPAGFPSPAVDYTDTGLDLNEYLIQRRVATFFFRIRGESMRDIGILDGDIAVVDRSLEARHNNIVVAAVDGQYTIKRLYRRGTKVELHAENPEFKPIKINSESTLEIWGIVTGIVRRFAV